MALNVNLQGFGQRPRAWQFVDAPADAQLRADHWVKLARTAEQGRLDAVFFADRPAIARPDERPTEQVDPMIAATIMAAATEQLGFVVSASTSFNEPGELASRLLSTDLATGGRLGWNVVTTYSDEAARNFGQDGSPPRSIRYQRAAEFVEIVSRLWRSAGSGDTVEFQGAHFSIANSLGIPPSPQHHPMIYQAGGSAQGRELAAAHADAVFAVALTRSTALREARWLHQRARQQNRHIHYLPGLSLIIGSTDDEARRMLAEMDGDEGDQRAISTLSQILGTPVGDLDRTQPVPIELLAQPADPDAHKFSLGYRTALIDLVSENPAITIDQILGRLTGFGTLMLSGSPEQIANEMEQWYRGGAVDGFTVMLDRLPDSLTTFVEHVVPLLQRRGVFRREYRGPTLRCRHRELSTGSIS